MKTPMSVTGIAPLIFLVALTSNAPAENKTDPAQVTEAKTQPAKAVQTLPTEPKFADSIPALDRSSQTLGVRTEANAKQDRVTPANLNLSPWASEVVKLAEAGIEDTVLLSFIENSGTFNLGADQIIYLNDLGVPSHVVTAMLQHDTQITSGIRMLTISSEPMLKLEWPKGFLDKKEASSASPKTVAATPTPVSVAAHQVQTDSARESSSSSTSTAPNFQTTATTFDMSQVSVSTQPSSSTKASTTYPVRESHTVELLPPIVFLNEVPQPANTIIIVGFPESTP